MKAAVRSLMRAKGWSTVVVLTLALGIGANSAVFAIAHAVLFRPLPYPQPQRLLSLSESDGGIDLSVVSSRNYALWSREARSLSAIGAYSQTNAVIQSVAEPIRAKGMLVTTGYLRALGVKPAHGRLIATADETIGAPPVMLLGDQLWQQLFARDVNLIGRAIVVDRVPTVVIGIMPPELATRSGAQVWMPLRVPAETANTGFFYNVVGRLALDAKIETVRAELTLLTRRNDAEKPVGERGRAPTVMTLRERRQGDSRPALQLLLAAVVTLLVIACVNVCNLFLARGVRRHKEFAVRAALGASRWQLMRQVLLESMMVSLMGGAISLLVPIVALGWVLKAAPVEITHFEDIHVDAMVLGFTLFATFAVTAVVALIPAVEASRTDAIDAGHGSGHATAGSRQLRLGRALIVFQLATALVLLTCASLFARSFASVAAIDVGFNAEDVMVADIDLPSAQYDASSATDFFLTLRERVRQVPGLESTALADVAPFGGSRLSTSTRTNDGRETPIVDVIGVSSGYFATVGTPQLAGREFQASDRAGAARVAIINATRARLSYPSYERAIGQEITLPDGRGTPATIVGVVKDVPQRELEAKAHAGLFIPIEQAGTITHAVLLARTREMSTFQRATWQAIRSMDRTIPAPSFSTLEQVVSDVMASRRFPFLLLTTFALLAGTLAGIGLFGVMAYLVAERTRELGIRLALGAEPRQLVGLVMRDGMILTALGIVIGAALSAAAAGLLRHMLFRVTAYDPVSFSTSAALLVVIALVACWSPASRAARTEPILVLRAE